MFPIIAAVISAVHGVIHLIGFVMPWQLATVDGFPYRTTQLAGLLDIGGVGARVVDGLWLVCVVAGVALWRAEPWAMPLVVGLALGSLVLCVLGLPESVVGVVVNIGIVAIAGYLILTGQTVAGLANR